MKVIDLYANLTIQTFDDKKLGRPLTRILSYQESELKNLNQNGAGIYWTINPQDTVEKRGITHTNLFACVGLDCDVTKETDEKKGNIRLTQEATDNAKKELLARLKNLPVCPSGIIDTRNGLQPYWVWKNPIAIIEKKRTKANEYYCNLVKGFTKVTGIKSEGDQIQRVLRLPGFFHMKSETPYLVTEVFPEGTLCDHKEFAGAYPPIQAPLPVIKHPTEKYTKLEEVPVQQALEKLSGMALVNNEEYSFRKNTNGTVQIIIDGKASGQWIDPTQNTIGGGGVGQGNPTIIQWVAWYYKSKGCNTKFAYARTYQVLYPLLLPHLAESQWEKKEPIDSLEKIVLPEIDEVALAKSLTDKEYAMGIQTGYKKFDRVTGGLRRQFSYLIAAQSKNLKSLLALNILFRVARQNIPVAYFDLENGDEIGNQRLLQIYSGWTTLKMKSLYETQDSEKKVIEMTRKMKQELPLYPVYSTGELHGETMHAKIIRFIRQYVTEKKVRVVCIDNLNCFVDSTKRDENQYKAEVITALDAVANELKISVIIIHHATDKNMKQKLGLTMNEAMEGKPKEFILPYISKVLGTSAAISKTKVGMTIAFDSQSKKLLVWIQTNRDGESDVRFPLYFDPTTRIIKDTFAEELPEVPEPTIEATPPLEYENSEKNLSEIKKLLQEDDSLFEGA